MGMSTNPSLSRYHGFILGRGRIKGVELVEQGMTVEEFKTAMAVDKKVLNGKLRLILLRGPLGNCVVTGDFAPETFDETLVAAVS
jgi:3-dehydroquinate synthetase